LLWTPLQRDFSAIPNGLFDGREQISGAMPSYDKTQVGGQENGTEGLMLGMIGSGHRNRLLLLAATAAWLLASGGARAQLAGMAPGAPTLGVPEAAGVPPVNIPLGTTELGTAGLSPLPGSTVPGLAPLGAGPNVMPGLGAGLSPPPASPAGSGLGDVGGLGTMPGMQPGTLP
jgi:hypothetical protein